MLSVLAVAGQANLVASLVCLESFSAGRRRRGRDLHPDAMANKKARPVRDELNDVPVVPPS